MRACSEGQYSEAERFLQQGIAIANDTGNQAMKASRLDRLSWVLWAQGDYARAERLVEEALEICQELGNQSGIGTGLVRLGEIATALGKHELAGQYYQRGLAIADEISHVVVKDQSLLGQGTLALAQGQYAEAKELFGKLSAAASISASAGLGHAALGLGEAYQARECLCQALEGAMNTEQLPGALDALVGLASLSAHEAQPARGVELLVLVVEHPATYHVDRTSAQDLLCELQSGLPPEMFAAAVARGQARELEDVAAEVLEER